MWFTRPSAPPPAARLVIAFDVGTTFSGVAYAIITPGATTTPVAEGVTRFLGLPNQAFKAPSVLWYKRDGTLHSAGGRAPKPQTGDAHDEDEDLICVEWFKLWLRPATLPSDGLRTADLVPLPAGKTVVDVLADYLGYLYASAQRFISEKGIFAGLFVAVLSGAVGVIFAALAA
ncbi:hypothetical protein PHLGIDRAFT_130522 [Phlebiopsis gigantea 11061_1 CR5-6]|uniref:Uncharacterized protein n=1 Tax=Phlebiopsis gigantea (strain 11061_1 CR5-6) TaxID=745531 RepID=A0A0C3S485_PHLG1|nr:hypothetical protein PHLGIDRAFT_130522 [Phlebiopsis gigantea 11061_1 CR5-6]